MHKFTFQKQDQTRGQISDYWSWSPRFDYRLYHGIFLEGEDSHGAHGLGSLEELRLRPLLVLHIHVSPSTPSGQLNCASWASQPRKSVTLRPQPGAEAMKSIRDMWGHWGKKIKNQRWQRTKCLKIRKRSRFMCYKGKVRPITILEGLEGE
jgi:hypothetical protein